MIDGLTQHPCVAQDTLKRKKLRSTAAKKTRNSSMHKMAVTNVVSVFTY